LQAIDSGHKEGNAAVAHHANAFGKAVEGLEFKAREVDALELGGGIQGRSSDSEIW
jgi:hypothetical protein